MKCLYLVLNILSYFKIILFFSSYWILEYAEIVEYVEIVFVNYVVDFLCQVSSKSENNFPIYEVLYKYFNVFKKENEFLVCRW